MAANPKALPDIPVLEPITGSCASGIEACKRIVAEYGQRRAGWAFSKEDDARYLDNMRRIGLMADAIRKQKLGLIDRLPRWEDL